MQITIIKNANQHKLYLERVNELFFAEKGTKEREELELLSLVLNKYETEKFPIPESNPIDIIKFLLEQNDISPSEFGEIIKSRSRASEIVHKKRKLTLTNIRMIKNYFNISVDTLIRDYDLV